MLHKPETTVMIHTGDKYEARARAERYSELRRIAGAIIGRLAPGLSPKDPAGCASAGLEAANDWQRKEDHAA